MKDFAINSFFTIFHLFSNMILNNLNYSVIVNRNAQNLTLPIFQLIFNFFNSKTLMKLIY